MWQIQTLLLLFFGALAIAATGTWLVLRRWKRVGVDEPDAFRKQHERPVSRLGGLPIFVALCTGFVVLGLRLPDFAHEWMPIIICNAIIFSVGFLDDLKPLGARVKLVGQLGAALILYGMGISIDLLTNPFGAGSVHLGWWSLPITLLWLVAIPNIVNLIDGMDGLATGFGMFLCLTLAFVGHFSMKPDVVLVATVMAGALAGFLIFNFPPAKIFLGDGGAYLIGFFVASVSLLSSNKGSIIAALLVMVIALGVPILDTTFAILRRAVRGMPIFRADAEHIHHRLILLGYSKGQALIALYAVCFVLSAIGISILIVKGVAIPVAGALVFVFALVAARYLGYVKSWTNVRKQLREALERRRHLEYVNAHATLLECEVERCADPEEFGPILENSLARLGFAPASAQDTVAMDLKLDSGKRIRLHRHREGDPFVDWHYKTDMLLPALNRSVERWQQVPGHELRAAPGAPATAPTATPQTGTLA